jgi:hypothetical protein
MIYGVCKREENYSNPSEHICFKISLEFQMKGSVISIYNGRKSRTNQS